MQQKSPEAFRTIGEVASWLGVPPHVLRFWESKFVQVRPVKRAGGRRYYRRGDMALLGGIKVLLHDRGMTIKGVQRILSEDGPRAVSAHAPELDPEMALASDAEDVFDSEAMLDEVEPELAEEAEAAEGPGQRHEAPAEVPSETRVEVRLEAEPEAGGEEAPEADAGSPGEEADPGEPVQEPVAAEPPAATEAAPAASPETVAARQPESQPFARPALRPTPVHAFAEWPETRGAEPPPRAVAGAAAARLSIAQVEGGVERGEKGEPPSRSRDLFEDAPASHADEFAARWDRPAAPARQTGREDRADVAMEDRRSSASAAAPPTDARAWDEAPAAAARPAPASGLPPPVPRPAGGGDGALSDEPDWSHSRLQPDASASQGVEPDPDPVRPGANPAADLARGDEGLPAPAPNGARASEAASQSPSGEAEPRRVEDVPACREDEGSLARRPTTRPAAVRANHDAVLALARRLEAVRDRMGL